LPPIGTHLLSGQLAFATLWPSSHLVPFQDLRDPDRTRF
jgi:hypothetical protein